MKLASITESTLATKANAPTPTPTPPGAETGACARELFLIYMMVTRTDSAVGAFGVTEHS
jgi:hypothetical protein